MSADVFVLSVGDPFDGYKLLSAHATVTGAANAAALHAERQLEFNPTGPRAWTSERTSADEYLIEQTEVQP